MSVSWHLFSFLSIFFSSVYASNPLNNTTQETIGIVPEKHLFPCAIIRFSFPSVSIIPSTPSELLMPFCLNAMVTALHPLIFKNKVFKCPFLSGIKCYPRQV